MKYLLWLQEAQGLRYVDPWLYMTSEREKQAGLHRNPGPEMVMGNLLGYKG